MMCVDHSCLALCCLGRHIKTAAMHTYKFYILPVPETAEIFSFLTAKRLGLLWRAQGSGRLEFKVPSTAVFYCVGVVTVCTTTAICCADSHTTE